MKITLAPYAVIRTLAIVVAFLSITSVAFVVTSYYVDNVWFGKVTRLFNLDEETNFPTYYQSFSLLLCGILPAFIASAHQKTGRPFVVHWRILSAAFFFLSIDEFTQLHEGSMYPLHDLFNSRGMGFLASGYFYDSWVIPALICVIIFVLTFWKFLGHLPSTTRRLLVIAGAIYLGGAVGMEMIGGHYKDLHGSHNITYAMMTTVEETGEMIGILIYIHALLSYVSDELDGLQLSLGER
jgi:hypothetical protein